MLAIESKQVIEMKEGNTIAPYTFRRVSNVGKSARNNPKRYCGWFSPSVLSEAAKVGSTATVFIETVY